MASSYDVIVVGAGPAGSITALTLARGGKRVALLDRAAFPRPKICGNCINPRAWEIWDKLGLTESFRALPHSDAEGFSLHCEGRTIHRETFQRRGPRVVDRGVFDDWLRRQAQSAGAEFFPETTVLSVDSLSGEVRTSMGDFKGALVVGADGRNSVVARHTGLMPPPRRCRRVAWQATIPAPTDLSRHVQMQVFEEGYFGYTRYSPDRAVISLVLDSHRSQDPLSAVRRFLPHVQEPAWMRMNPITRAPAQLGRDRVWLVGDSARVVEPFTGEGISFALASGMLAGETALKGLGDGDLSSALKSYASKHRALYRRRAWVNTLVRWMLIEPARTVRLLRLHPPESLISFLSQRVHAA